MDAIQERIGAADFKILGVFDALAEHGFPAFSATLTPAGLNLLMKLEMAEYVEESQVVQLSQNCNVQTDNDWGTRRTNIRGSYTAGSYYYTTGKSGSGVDAYIVDTGIYCQNNDFATKATTITCTCGKDFIVAGGSCTDGNGHGTHVAGTVAGKQWGVAKEANLIAVRVLDDSGSGSTAGVINGINWVASNAKATGKPSVANMSLGGGFNQGTNDATNAAVSSGVSFVVAAGNNNLNACNYSPASAASAVTVGATDISDTRASYSNYGSCLDIFGPGTNIKSAWIGSVNATNVISGTSMASPQVCGVAAKYLSANTALKPADITAKLIADATKNIVKNANGPTASPSNVSPNLMVYGYCV